MPLAFDPSQVSVARDTMGSLGIVPNRTLGQNFLINGDALDRIVATAQLEPGESALEIGPGLGALTVRLLEATPSVVSIEKDRDLAKFLRRKLSKLTLIEGDALDVEWESLGLPETGVKIVANLPYSISKPILRKFLEDWRPHLTSATVLVQREVADRLVSAPGTRDYGPMSVMATLYSNARKVFDIAPGSFLPPPNVVSTVVHLEMRAEPAITLSNEKYFWTLVRAAFGQRRKTLGNTLKVLAPRETLTHAFEATQIDPTRRGETLSLEEFGKLSDTLRALVAQKPAE